jgi:hypothetical protein
LAKNRYGWQKRAKELARKQKHDDKMKRRQNKAATVEAEERPQVAEDEVTEPSKTELQPNSVLQD